MLPLCFPTTKFFCCFFCVFLFFMTELCGCHKRRTADGGHKKCQSTQRALLRASQRVQLRSSHTAYLRMNLVCCRNGWVLTLTWKNKENKKGITNDSYLIVTRYILYVNVYFAARNGGNVWRNVNSCPTHLWHIHHHPWHPAITTITNATATTIQWGTQALVHSVSHSLGPQSINQM